MLGIYMKVWNWIKENVIVSGLCCALLTGVFWGGNANANINTLKERNIELVSKIDKQQEQFDKIDTKLDNILSNMSTNHSDVNSRLAVIEYKLNIKK